jgi:hypothetical protein
MDENMEDDTLESKSIEDVMKELPENGVEMMTIVSSMREQFETKFGFTVSGFALCLVKEDGEPISVVDCRNFNAMKGILECVSNVTSTVADLLEKGDAGT